MKFNGNSESLKHRFGRGAHGLRMVLSLIEGNLVKHPIEQKRIEIIMRLPEAGHKAWRIQEELK